MKDVVARLQRELPDTDKDRYDIAYQRGRAQARSALLAGGLAVGSAVGAGLMWLMDPARGAARRAQLTERFGGLRNQVSQTVSGKTEDLGNRVTGFAIERGIKQPENGTNDDLGVGNGRSGVVSQPGSYVTSSVGLADLTDTPPASSGVSGVSGVSGTSTTTAGGATDYGEGYREGFGATEHDPTAPGSQVPDPIQADEIVEYGSSGPVAGAAHDDRTSIVSRSTEEEEAANTR
jgi:hypothetical protein